MNEDKVNEWVNSNLPEYFKDFIRELVSDMEQRGATFDEVVNVDCTTVCGRSEPGKGQHIFLSVMGPAEDFDDPFFGSINGVSCITSINEDYAQCSWPIVLKVKPGTDRRFVAKALRQYASDIESSDRDNFPYIKDKLAMYHDADCPF